MRIGYRQVYASLSHSLTFSSKIVGSWLRIYVANFFFEKVAVVEMRRIELLPPCLQGRCSPSCATPPDRILYVANFCFAKVALVGLSGLEPPTSRLSGVRSNRLSYRPMQGFFNGFLSSFPLIFSSIFNCECPISRLYTQKQIVRFLSLRISLFVRP